MPGGSPLNCEAEAAWASKALNAEPAAAVGVPSRAVRAHDKLGMVKTAESEKGAGREASFSEVRRGSSSFAG